MEDEDCKNCCYKIFSENNVDLVNFIIKNHKPIWNIFKDEFENNKLIHKGNKYEK